MQSETQKVAQRLQELAECLYLMDRLDEAGILCTGLRHAGQEAWFVANEPERLQRLAKLGEVDID